MSTQNTLNTQDILNWIKNMSIFFGPVALIYLVYVIGNITTAGFSWNVFAINQVTQGAMALYILNAVVDLIKKFLAGNPTT